MRTYYLGMIFVGLVACADDPIGPVAAAPIAPLLSAEATTTVTKFPFASSEYNPCVPEWIQFSGTIHSSVHFTSRDGLYVLVVHSQFDIDGVGESTGDRYRVQRLSTEIINQLAFDQAPYEDHLIQATRLIRESSGDSYKLHAVWQVTVAANGEWSAQVDRLLITCS